jgi:MFS superfamily sulfate permease-like transporter
LAIGVGTITFIFVLRRFAPRLPAGIIAVTLGSAAVASLALLVDSVGVAL